MSEPRVAGGLTGSLCQKCHREVDEAGWHLATRRVPCADELGGVWPVASVGFSELKRPNKESKCAGCRVLLGPGRYPSLFEGEYGTPKRYCTRLCFDRAVDAAFSRVAGEGHGVA
jgi:hypothetical protein